MLASKDASSWGDFKSIDGQLSPSLTLSSSSGVTPSPIDKDP